MLAQLLVRLDRSGVSINDRIGRQQILFKELQEAGIGLLFGQVSTGPNDDDRESVLCKKKDGMSLGYSMTQTSIYNTNITLT